MIPGILLVIRLKNTVSKKVANCSSYSISGGVAIFSTEKVERLNKGADSDFHEDI